MNELTETQKAHDAMRRIEERARKDYEAVAKAEFTPGTKVRWQHIYGKPKTEGAVKEVGYLGVAQVTTKSGAIHRVEAYRLEKIAPEA